MPCFDTLNIEKNLPTVDQARQMLTAYLDKAKRSGIRVCKVIHGYGSSGVGGKLRIGLRKSLAIKKANGSIKDYVPGEDWNIFNETSRKILDACPELSRDTDLGRHNNGITLILL